MVEHSIGPTDRQRQPQAFYADGKGAVTVFATATIFAQLNMLADGGGCAVEFIANAATVCPILWSLDEKRFTSPEIHWSESSFG